MAHILIVDDYPVTLRVLSMQLRKGGYEVTIATSAGSALAAMEQNDFDLGLFDVATPGVDGIALMDSIRQRWPENRMPVIALAASVSDADRVRAEEAGAVGFMTKPISSWELLEVVERQIGLDIEHRSASLALLEKQLHLAAA